MIPDDKYREIMDLMPILCVDGLVIDRLSGKYLLIKRKNEPLRGKWWIPGGRVNKGEKLEDAIKRKVFEETGLRVKILSLVGYYEDLYKENIFKLESGVHTLSVVFLLLPIGGRIRLDKHHSGFKYAFKLPEELKLIKPLQ